MQSIRILSPGAMLLVLVAASGWAQSLYPYKDLVFPQVAAGGIYETVITLTNKGSAPYQGTLFFRSGANLPWNPRVDGVPLSNGEMAVSLDPGSTRVFRVTGDEAASGFALLLAPDLRQDNLVEGNLTYTIESEGRLVDSVGIFPAGEFYLSSLSFDEFSTVALALVNPDLLFEDSTEASLRLYSSAGALVSVADVELQALEHRARFLFELFPGVELTRGRLEIRSAVPIVGTALTLVGDQHSSLPLLPSPTTYGFRAFEFDGAEIAGDLTLWAEARFVNGYLRIREVDGTPLDPMTFLVHGRLSGGDLHLTFLSGGPAFFDESVILHLHLEGFSFDPESLSLPYEVIYLEDEFLEDDFFRVTAGTMDLVWSP